MKPTNWPYLLFVFFLLIGCNQEQGRAAQPDSQQNEGTRSDATQPESSQPESTQFTHGECHFNIERQEKICECGEGKVLVGQGDSANCVDIYKQNTCLLRNNGYQIALEDKSGELFDSCLIFENSNKKNSSLWSPSLQMTFGNGSKGLKLEFAKWADQNKDRLSNLKLWQSSNLVSAETYLIGGSISDLIGFGIANPFQMPNRKVDDFAAYPAPKYFASVADLDFYFSNPEEKNQMENIELLPATGKSLYSFYQSIDLSIIELNRSNMSNDVEGSQVQSSQKYESIDGFFQIKTYLIGDYEYRKEIVKFDSYGTIEGVLYLVGNQISLFVNIDRNLLGFPERVRMYTRFGDIVFDQRSNSFTPAMVTQEQSEFLNQQPKDISIGVCEDEISPDSMKTAGLWNHIQFGPNTDVSYYGWQNTLSSPENYFQGRRYLNDWQLTYNNLNLGNHAVNVIGTLLKSRKKSENIGIVPLGFGRNCLNSENVDTWFETVNTWFENKLNQSKMRVINFSASSQETDKKSCKEISNQNSLLKNKSQYLWVVAAGNQGVNHPISCPQYLYGEENILVVGAFSDGYSSNRSNYGAFVDLIADGNSSVSESWGTSFAAPRVARVAAEIFAMESNLLPVEVKAILISTADSKRSFNGDKAIELAKSYVKQDGNSKRALEEVYPCSWRLWRCSSEEAKARNQIFEKIMKGQK